MVLAASCEFDKRLNSEVVERPSDNEEIPEVINKPFGDLLLVIILLLSGLTVHQLCYNHT